MIETLYKYVDLKGLKLILKDKTLKFTNPKDFNDPFEFHDKLVDRKISEKHRLRIIRKYDKSLTKEKLKRYKEIIRQDIENPQDNIIKLFEQRKQTSSVTCFSEINNNLLMWANYADKHRGACIGFNTKTLYSNFKNGSYLSNVKYSRKLITKRLSKLGEDAISHWICSKGKDWQYEKEVRIILGSNNSEFMTFNIQSIKEIIFGCRVNEDEKKDIETQIYNEYNYDWIQTSEMKISNKEFKLEKNIRR